MQTQTVSAQHKTVLVQYGPLFRQYPTLATLATLAFIDSTPYMFL